MKRSFIFGSMLAISLATPLTVLAAPGPPTAEELAGHRAINPQAATDCNLCYTCGGDWPITAGWFYTVSPYNVGERYSACSGALTTRVDSSPRLCCKD